MARSRAAFDRFILSLPAATLSEQWGCSCAKVGGKVFALHHLADAGTVFKVGETSFEVLTGTDGIGQAPYFAKGQWVRVAKGALPDRDLRAYIVQSQALVVRKLTRKARADLGLAD